MYEIIKLIRIIKIGLMETWNFLLAIYTPFFSLKYILIKFFKHTYFNPIEFSLLFDLL